MKTKIIEALIEDSTALETILISNKEKVLLLNAQILEITYKLEQNHDIIKYIESLEDDVEEKPKNPQPREGRTITKRRL